MHSSMIDAADKDYAICGLTAEYSYSPLVSMLKSM